MRNAETTQGVHADNLRHAAENSAYKDRFWTRDQGENSNTDRSVGQRRYSRVLDRIIATRVPLGNELINFIA